MHVFLTGARQVGKSWAVRRTAEALGLPCRGFLTRFLAGETGEKGGSALYMVPPDQPDLADESHLVAVREGGKMRPLPGRFDSLGVQLLREAGEHKEALILMDELGHLEKDARLFQRAILERLDGDIPVLGVLRQGQPWHGFIISHPRVRVLTVTEENRNGIEHEIMRLLREE